MTVTLSRENSAETSKADHQALYLRQSSSRSNGQSRPPTQGAPPSRQVSEVASVQGSSPPKKSGFSRQVSWCDEVQTGNPSRQFSRQASGENSRGISKADHQALYMRQQSGKSHQGPLSRQMSQTQSQRADGADLSRSVSMHEVQSRQVSGKSAACHEESTHSRQVSGKSATCHGATPAISRQASGAAPAISRQASGAAPSISRQASGAAPAISRQASGAAPAVSRQASGAAPAISRQASGAAPAVSRQASGAAPAISRQASGAAPARQASATSCSRSLKQLPENEPVFQNVLTGGKLRLRIKRASNLRNEDTGVLGDVSDPFAVAKFCEQEFKTATINNNLSPQWNSDLFEFDVKSEDAKLHLEVFNSNWVSKHDSLGTTELSLKDLTPGSTQTLVKVLDEGDKKSADRESSIEVELELIPRAPVKVHADPPVSPGVKKTLTGCKLRLWVVRASNLRNMDTGVLGDVSDPFAVAQLCGQEFTTATINNDLNPVWNSDVFEFNVKSEDAKLHLEVFNSNFISQHDCLGNVEVCLHDLVLGATQTLTKVLDEGDSKSADREASIEVKLELVPPAKTSKLAGNKLKLRVIRASNLRNLDTGVMGDVSDPFTVAKLGSLEFKTATINNDLNPVWNSDSFEFSIPIEDSKLHLEVFNSNWVSNHDSLGTAEIDLDDFEAGATQALTKVLDEGANKQADKEALIEVELEVIACTTVLAVAATEEKKSRFLKTQDWVPLPNFNTEGAYERPAWNDNNGYSHGRLQPVNEYYSYACRLGQYDYQETPTYYPRQAEVCKETWIDDPFHRWRRTISTVTERF